MISPATPVSSLPTTRAAAPKRRLLNTGPRPLQLVGGTRTSASLSSTPVTSPTTTDDGQDLEFASPLSPTSTGSRTGSARRQSSISYKPLDSGDDRRGTPTIRTGAMPSPGTTETTGANAGSVHGPNGLERLPLTLAERCVGSFILLPFFGVTFLCRHGELLQFIAQKESKCLELRTQLAVHEAELLQRGSVSHSWTDLAVVDLDSMQ